MTNGIQKVVKVVLDETKGFGPKNGKPCKIVKRKEMKTKDLGKVKCINDEWRKFSIANGDIK